MRHGGGCFLPSQKKSALSVCCVRDAGGTYAMRLLVTGATHGVGRAVAQYFAQRQGSNLIVGLLSNDHHSAALPEVARDVRRYGAIAFQLWTQPCRTDTPRYNVNDFLADAGGLDVLVHASFTRSKSDDMYYTNTRTTLACFSTCREALTQSSGAIVTIAPPVRMGHLEWFQAHGVAHTVARYATTMATLAEAREGGVRANCLWPRHAVDCAATSAGVARCVYELAMVQTHRNAQCVMDDDVLPFASSSDGRLNAYAEARHVTHPHV